MILLEQVEYCVTAFPCFPSPCRCTTDGIPWEIQAYHHQKAQFYNKFPVRARKLQIHWHSKHCQVTRTVMTSSDFLTVSIIYYSKKPQMDIKDWYQKVRLILSDVVYRPTVNKNWVNKEGKFAVSLLCTTYHCRALALLLHVLVGHRVKRPSYSYIPI